MSARRTKQLNIIISETPNERYLLTHTTFFIICTINKENNFEPE